MIHETAIIEPFVELGVGVVIHPFAWLGKMPAGSRALARVAAAPARLRIGDRTEIGPHAVIYAGVEIGADCLIGDQSSIREGSRIEARCIVGQGVSVHYEAVIADDVRVMNGTHLTGGIRIGRGTFIGVGVVTSNDRKIDPTDYAFRGSDAPVIGEFVMIGSGANILAGVTIGNRAMIGAGALVVENVPDFGLMLGAKARLR